MTTSTDAYNNSSIAQGLVAMQTVRDEMIRIAFSTTHPIYNGIYPYNILPKTEVDVVPGSTSRHTEIRYDFAGVAELKELTYDEDGFGNIFHFLRPVNQTRSELVIYHQGHDGGATRDGHAYVQRFLDEGYAVVAISMPLIGPNYPGPVENHDAIFDDYPNTYITPFKYFLHPTISAINKYTSEFTEIFMVGHSGGGWTTMMMAAMDDRIKKSFPVSGGWPLYMRWAHDPHNAGDAEQITYEPELHQQAKYIDKFIIASIHGRSQTQYFVHQDPCCFAGIYPTEYEDLVKGIAQNNGGDFDIVMDYTTDQHHI
ncbi:MAG: hypothetical protein MJA29_04380 [Candidatus Omnitrophica bacterium]|nr:hypothetical protein [Candidatus Omnitrophota bacterium]